MFTLPQLPYEYDALAPYIHKDIQVLHHTKHHQTYVDNLNKTLAGHEELLEKPIDQIIASLNDLPEEIKTAVQNHGGGHLNHSMFWEMMAPAKGQKPSSALESAIGNTFGGVEEFTAKFNENATKIFGSGWQWLVYSDGKLSLEATLNQDSPLTEGKIPLLGLDVWEHAYYLQYFNKRVDYVAAWWNIVNWDYASEKFEQLSKN